VITIIYEQKINFSHVILILNSKFTKIPSLMRFHWFYGFCANKKRRTEARLLSILI